MKNVLFLNVPRRHPFYHVLAVFILGAAILPLCTSAAIAAPQETALGHWQQAESLFQAVSGRYSEPGEWYFFCKRSGRGDLESARQLMLDSLAPGTENPGGSRDDLQIATYYLLEKQPEKALPLMEAAFRRQGNPYAGLFVLLLDDQLKKDTQLPETLRQLKTRGPGYRWPATGRPRPELVALGALLGKDRELGAKADIDAAVTDRLVQNAHDLEKPILYYFLAKYFSLHGKPEQAVIYWKKCVAHSPGRVLYSRTLACAELRDRGIDPLADDPPKPVPTVPKPKDKSPKK